MIRHSILTLLFLIFSHTISQSQPTLKSVLKHNFYIGAALNHEQIIGNDPRSMEIVEQQFNSITPENVLKWEKVHPAPGVYDFAAADKFVEWGEKNKMFLVGHTLVWHQQVPRWVFLNESGATVDGATLLQRLREHISTVVGRYKDRIHGWDVVNEAINDQTGELRRTKWLEILGEDYLLKAFEFAREADPAAELYYNDYSLCDSVKREGVVRLVKNLQAKGAKVAGIGLQGHWALDYPSIEELEKSIVTFAGLGVKVMITELDINVLPTDWGNIGADISANFELQQKYNPYPTALPDSVQQRLTKRYQEIFALFQKHQDKISRVTFWGVTDAHSWLNNWPVRGRTNYPLLFDREYQPKPAFQAVLDILKQRR